MKPHKGFFCLPRFYWLFTSKHIGFERHSSIWYGRLLEHRVYHLSRLQGAASITWARARSKPHWICELVLSLLHLPADSTRPFSPSERMSVAVGWPPGAWWGEHYRSRHPLTAASPACGTDCWLASPWLPVGRRGEEEEEEGPMDQVWLVKIHFLSWYELGFNYKSNLR